MKFLLKKQEVHDNRARPKYIKSKQEMGNRFTPVSLSCSKSYTPSVTVLSFKNMPTLPRRPYAVTRTSSDYHLAGSGDVDTRLSRQRLARQGNFSSSSSFNTDCRNELKGVLRKRRVWLEGEDDVLDPTAFRRQLKHIDSPTWDEVLQLLLDQGPLFMDHGFIANSDKTGALQNTQHVGLGEGVFKLDENAERDLKYFLRDILLACVEENLNDHLEVTLKWISHLDEQHRDKLCIASLKMQINDPILKAGKKMNIAAVFALYREGFHIQSFAHSNQVINQLEHELMKSLDKLEGRAGIIYLLAEYKHGSVEKNYKDPVDQAMRLIRQCSNIAKAHFLLEEKAKKIKISLEKFVVKILSLCDRGEVEKFLKRD